MTCASSEDSDQPGHLPSLTCLSEKSLGPLATHKVSSEDSGQTGFCHAPVQDRKWIKPFSSNCSLEILYTYCQKSILATTKMI